MEDNKENLVLIICGKCQGRGKNNGWTCPTCHGKGKLYVTKCCGWKQENCECKLDN